MSDVRYAIRQLAKNPGFTVIAVFALALGIGANTAIFSVVNAVLLRPLPYPGPDQLTILRERSLSFPSGSVSYPNYLDWRAGQHSFTDIALVRRESFNFARPGSDVEPERLNGARVTYNYLSILGLKPLIGRDFAEHDDVPGCAAVCLIGEKLWRGHFGAQKNIVGQQVMVDGVQREIVGVLPARITFPRLAQIWVPLGDMRKAANIVNRGNHAGFSAFGRLKPGVTLEKAGVDLNTIAAGLEKEYPGTNTGRRVELKPILEAAVGEYRQSLQLLLAAVGCVLLIACANVANLQLARSLARGKELAVRAALGASRWRLARQLLTESTLIAALGAITGVVLAIWSLDAILSLCPRDIPRFGETRIDGVALTYTAVIAMAAGILSGIWPAWRISRADALSVVLHEAAARGGTGTAARQRARSALVITQVALAVVLLAGAGLTLKSFWCAENTPLNFDPHNVLVTSLAIPKARYDSDEKTREFWTQLLERLHAAPGVEAVAIGDNIPFDDNESDSYFHVTDTPKAEPGKEPSAEVNFISPDYFKVMRMPILRGRAFGPEEVPDRPGSVIIDTTFAQKFFPGRDAIGQHIDDNQKGDLQKGDTNAPPLTVVGIVPRSRNEAPGEENVEKLGFVHMYYPYTQYPDRESMLMVRTTLPDPRALVPVIKREVQALDRDQPIGSISTMEENISASLSTRRLTMGLLAAFAGLALLLASVGLYGVMALSVAQRTRELGIRLALGAARADVFRLVLGKGAALIGVGLALGLLGALAAGRALASVLYGVGAIDLSALVTSMVSLMAVAMLACFFPARRATRVDPVIALRSE